MHRPGFEPGPPAWQARIRILPLNWHQCPIKNWLVSLKEALWWNFYGENKKKEKENQKHTKTNKQTNKKNKVERGKQIIRK